MALDPSIIMSGRPIEFQSPLDSMAKAMTLRDLSQRGQIQSMQMSQMQRQMSDENAMRSALQKHVTIGPDGQPRVDSNAVQQELMQTNAPEAIKYGAQARQDQLDQLKKQTEIAHEIAWQIPTEPTVPMDIKQSKWVEMKQRAAQFGLPNVDKLPDQYPGDDFVKNMQMHTVSAKEQLAQQNSDRDYDIKDRHEKTYEKETQARREANQLQKENQGMYQTTQLLESARGNPAVQQAQKDIYAAKKFESLMNLYGDPNKLNPQQVQLGATEVMKIASGGVPAQAELKHMTPDSIPGWLADKAQFVLNHPTAASQGEFVKAMGDYVGALKKDAQSIVKDKYGRVIESQRGRIGNKNADLLNSQYLDPLLKESASAKGLDSTPVGATAKAKDGTPVVYKGNGVWEKQ
jgi:hypothetical protein